MALPGTERQRDREAGQNVWDRRAGTERLGSVIFVFTNYSNTADKNIALKDSEHSGL